MSAKPVVYFIDDSATMREVIKIAFRREDARGHHLPRRQQRHGHDGA